MNYHRAIKRARRQILNWSNYNYSNIKWTRCRFHKRTRIISTCNKSLKHAHRMMTNQYNNKVQCPYFLPALHRRIIAIIIIITISNTRKTTTSLTITTTIITIIIIHLQLLLFLLGSKTTMTSHRQNSRLKEWKKAVDRKRDKMK